MKKFLIAVLAVIASFSASAADTVTDTQLWMSLNGTYHLNDKWMVWTEIAPRFNKDISDVRNLIVRPGLGYQATEKLSLWFGYMAQMDNDFDHEDRLFQQATWTTKLTDSVTFQSRTRLEERWIEGFGAGDPGLRARQMLRFEVAVNDKVYVPVFDEMFVNLDNTSHQSQGFDQNRAFGGLGYKLNKHVKFETGYQVQWQPHDVGPNNWNNIWLTQLWLNY